jgi:hypothetical protein
MDLINRKIKNKIIIFLLKEKNFLKGKGANYKK